jgi:signal transduction histidine kinase
MGPYAGIRSGVSLPRPAPDRAEVLVTRLIWFLRYDIPVNVAALVMLLAVYGTVTPNGLLLVAAVTVLGHLALDLWAVRVGRTRPDRAVTALVAGGWAIALVATLLFPFTLPIMMLTALVPVALAVPYLPSTRTRLLALALPVVIAALSAVGRLQQFSTAQDETPAWLLSALLLFFTPLLAGALGITLWQNTAVLTEALADAESANRRLRASRARVVAAADDARRRIERDVHDGAQQPLLAARMTAQLAQRSLARDPAAAGSLLDQLGEELDEAIANLRELAQGIFPTTLTDHGLGAAVTAIARRAPVPVTVAEHVAGRHAASVEAAAYFCCVEALQNACRHGGPGTTVMITATDDDGHLVADIADTGAGFDPAAVARNSGLMHMTDRVAAVAGTLAIDSTPGTGTRIRVEIPVT